MVCGILSSFTLWFIVYPNGVAFARGMHGTLSLEHAHDRSERQYWLKLVQGQPGRYTRAFGCGARHLLKETTLCRRGGISISDCRVFGVFSPFSEGREGFDNL